MLHVEKTTFFFIILFSFISCLSNDINPDNNKEVNIMKPRMDWEILKALKGEFYTNKRDELMTSTKDLTKYMEKFSESDNWEDVIQASIITGWINHKDLYLQLFAEFDNIDPKAEKTKVAGMSRIWDGYATKAINEYKKSILPLCWEALLKYTHTMEKWKIITFIYMLCAVPDELSLHVLEQFIETTDDPAYYDIILFELERTPWTGLKEWFTDLHNKHKTLVEKIEKQLNKL